MEKALRNKGTMTEIDKMDELDEHLGFIRAVLEAGILTSENEDPFTESSIGVLFYDAYERMDAVKSLVDELSKGSWKLKKVA